MASRAKRHFEGPPWGRISVIEVNSYQGITLSTTDTLLPDVVIAHRRSGPYKCESYINERREIPGRSGILLRSSWRGRQSFEILSPLALERLSWLPAYSGDPDQQIYSMVFRNPRLPEEWLEFKNNTLGTVAYELQVRAGRKIPLLKGALYAIITEIRRGVSE